MAFDILRQRSPLIGAENGGTYPYIRTWSIFEINMENNNLFSEIISYLRARYYAPVKIVKIVLACVGPLEHFTFTLLPPTLAMEKKKKEINQIRKNHNGYSFLTYLRVFLNSIEKNITIVALRCVSIFKLPMFLCLDIHTRIISIVNKKKKTYREPLGEPVTV